MGIIDENALICTLKTKLLNKRIMVRSRTISKVEGSREAIDTQINYLAEKVPPRGGKAYETFPDFKKPLTALKRSQTDTVYH